MITQPTGPCPAKIMIVGEFPGFDEEKTGMPFMGMAGQELSRMLSEAGIMRSECFITNVIRIRPPGNDIESFIPKRKKDVTSQHKIIRDKNCLAPVEDGIALLKLEIEMCQPNVIIALGNAALWALTGEDSVSLWRNSTLECDLTLNLDYKPKVIPTFSPATILRQYSWRQICIHDLKKCKRESGFREIIRPNYSFVIRPDYSTVLTILNQLYEQLKVKKGKLSVDIETRAGHTACIGIAWSKTEALCIPLMCVENHEGYWTASEESSILFALYQILTHENVEIIGQNFLYDAQYFNRGFHFLPRLIRDTMIAQHVLFPNMQKGLDFLASMYCSYYVYWKGESKDWNPKVGEEQLWTYNCKDAVITFEVDEAQQLYVDSMNLREVHDFQQRLFWPVLRTMIRGIRLDEKLKRQYAITLQDEMAVREQWMLDVLGHPLNPKSPKQMQTFFYEDLKMKPAFNRKTKQVSCDHEALTKLAEKEPLLLPFTRKISEQRSLGVFYSTFVMAPADIDGRMRCSFNIAGTETFRFSSSEDAFGSGMNLQNIPKGEDSEGLTLPNVRELFIPDQGMTFFDIDLDSADLRIVAWEAELAEMKAMLAEGKKVYVEVMKEYFKNPSMTKHDKEYTMFKSLCHGTHYLGTGKGLAERLGLGVHEVEVIQKWYFGKFPGLKKWQDDMKSQLISKRYVENIFGYRCYFLDRIEGTIFNQAIAWIPQSTVACLINRAYEAVDRDLPFVEVLLQVHDSLAGQYPTHLGEWAANQIVAKSAISLPYKNDPLIIPVGIKTSTKSWGNCG